MYKTGVQNIDIGFNVSMLTTAGTIANTGPPPTCSMRICNSNGEDIGRAEVGDSLMLKVGGVDDDGGDEDGNDNDFQ